MAAAAQISETYNAQTGKFSTRPLAMLKVGFGNSSNKFKVDLIYDIPNTRFLTCSASWQPLPQIGIQIGLQKMLFLYDNNYAPYMYGMIGYSQATSALAGYSSDITGINSRSRDVGIVLQGSFFPSGKGFSWLSYAIGLFNGNGYSFIDNNRAKDFHARLLFQPHRHLKISLGAMNGFYKAPEGAPRLNGGHHHGEEDLACRQRVSGGVWYEGRKWFARCEDIFGITDGIHSNGIMALAGCMFHPKFQLAARVDRYKSNLSDPLTASTKADICFTHHLTGDGTIYYAIQYGHTFYSDPARPGTDSIMLCVNIAFLRNL